MGCTEIYEAQNLMKLKSTKLWSSLQIGFAMAFGCFICAALAGGSVISRVTYWPGYLLENLVPAPNLGSAAKPFYEATPIHFVVFFLGIPFSIIVYSLLSYVILTIWQKK